MSKSAGVRLLFEVWRRIRNWRYRSSGQPMGSGKLCGFQLLQAGPGVGVDPDRVRTETLVSESSCFVQST